jgi:conjugal transfer mating pair stabilization protein TraN
MRYKLTIMITGLMLSGLCFSESPDLKNCVQQKTEVCIEGAETRLISGVPIFKECWAYRATYLCLDQSSHNSCTALQTQGCTQSSSVCTEKTPTGECLQYEQTYQCPTTAAREVEQTICTDTYCSDGQCANQDKETDGDFSKSVAMMEAAREGGVYGIQPNQTLNIFSGNSNKCTLKVAMGGTIKSCCSIESGGEQFTNRATLNYKGNATNSSSISFAGVGASYYTYDALDDEDQAELKNFIEGTLTAGWLSCSDKEKTLALKRGQSLCEYVDEECSERVSIGLASTCVEKTRTYCCFKSKLAKAINTQGKAQLGQSRRDCRGFTMEELDRIDFSKINLDEFIDSIVPKSFNLDERSSNISSKLNGVNNVGDFYE